MWQVDNLPSVDWSSKVIIHQCKHKQAVLGRHRIRVHRTRQPFRNFPPSQHRVGWMHSRWGKPTWLQYWRSHCCRVSFYSANCTNSWPIGLYIVITLELWKRSCRCRFNFSDAFRKGWKNDWKFIVFFTAICSMVPRHVGGSRPILEEQAVYRRRPTFITGRAGLFRS